MAAITPLTYDGSTNPATFARKFKIQALYQDWDEDAQLKAIPILLEGAALEHYNEILVAKANSTTVEILVELTKRCVQPREKLLDDFFDRTQQPGESITSFAKALKELITQAEPSMDPDTRKSLLIRQLSKALPPYMQTLIDFCSTMTWENLLAKLDKSNYQQQKWDEQKLAQIPTNLIKQEPCDLNWLDSSSNARGSNNNHRTTNSNRSNNSTRFNGTCNYCRRVGHKEAECRTKAREQQQENGTFNNSNDNNDNNGKPNNNNYNNNNGNRPNTYNNNNNYRNNNNNSTNSNSYRTNNNNNYRQLSQQNSVHQNSEQQNIGQQNSGQHSQQTNTHALEVNNESVTSNTNIEFPFYAHTATVEMNSVSKQITPTPLPLFVHLILFKQEPRILKALLDSGSSHSFISPSIMSQSQLRIASDTNNSLSERHNFIITSATGIAKSACSVTTAEIEIGSWKGEHSFIISGAVTKHEMIIGRDFFKRNKVIVNHANDSITIDEMLININTICSISTKLPFDDTEYFSINELDNSQLILTKFNELQKDIKECKIVSDKIIQAFTNAKETDQTLIQIFSINAEQQQQLEDKESEELKTQTTCDQTDCKVKSDTTICAHSQRLVPLFTCIDLSSIGKTNTLMFEPIQPFPKGCLIARSINSKDPEKLYCNVINSSDADVVLKQNQAIGHLSEAEIAEEKFEENVKRYTPLSINKLIQFAGKLYSSKPINDAQHLQHEITTTDILIHEMKNRLKQLRTGKLFTNEQRVLLMKVLEKNIEVFQWNPNEIGRTKLVEHKIPTGHHEPIQQRQYPIPSVARDNMKDQVASMLKNEFIRPSSSSWRSPVMLAKKKKTDGTVAYRFCVDLKQINSLTNKDSYSLPRICETVDALSGAKYFSTIDIDRAFWQVGVAEEDKEKTAFVMDGKLFEFNVMPFGSMNASSTFQRLMDRVLRGLTWKQCLVYVDDVLIFSSSFENHLQDIDEVLSRFKFAGLKLKPTKCTFADNEVEYLGFKITDRGLAASNSKVEAIMKITPPSTTKNLYSFLCSVNYYRTLIPNYGRITSELYKMCEGKSRHCQWSSLLLKNFTDLKQALISAPVLAFPDFSIPFHIQTDASNNAIGAVLLQEVDKLFKPIAFASRKLSETEKRYSATERELLALVYAYDQFYSHVYGRHIKFYTDHEPLSTMNKLKNPLGRLGRLFHRLQDVDYEIIYVPGPENYLPDFLSRSFEPEIESNYIKLKSSVDWVSEQAKDEEIKQIVKLIEIQANDLEWLKIKSGSRWLREKRELYLSSGVLKHGNDKIVCPQLMKISVLLNHHDSPFGGHRAYETTLVSIRNRYYWNYMPAEVKLYCQSCTSCQMFNYACIHNVAPLKPIQVSRPWQLVGVDFMGIFKTSRHGNKYIILAIDHFTKYVEGAATPTFDAPTTALFLFNNIICRYGMIEKLLSDQGVNFESNLLKQLCLLIGTDKLHTSTYHAAGNGITERVNKVIKPDIAKYVNDDHDDWDLFLQMAIAAYNTSFHSTIKMTPYEAQFGRKPVIVADIILNNQLPADTKIKDVSEFTIALRKSAEHISELIRDNTANAQTKQKFYYDRFVKDRAQYNVGDTVKINNYKSRIGHSKAFEPKFLGPYKITKILGELNYRLESPTLPVQIVHYNRMNHFHVRTEFINEPITQSNVRILNNQPKSTLAAYIKPNIDLSNMSIIQNQNLKRLKKKASRALLTEFQRLGGIDSSDHPLINTGRVTERHVAPVQHTIPHQNLFSSSSSSDEEAPVNLKGKAMAKCQYCNKLYEKKTGIRIHQMHCKKKK